MSKDQTPQLSKASSAISGDGGAPQFADIIPAHDPSKFIISVRRTDNERQILLTQKTTHVCDYIFPRNSKSRRYNVEWQKVFPWIRYSTAKNEVFSDDLM